MPNAARSESATLRIREYDPVRDRESLLRCIVELQEFERGLDERLPTGASIAEQMFAQTFSEQLDSRPKLFVADLGGEVVGYCRVLGSHGPEDVAEMRCRYALVTDLVVLPQNRRGGAGRLLLERAERHALDCGVDWVRVCVLARNRTARAFYAELGFEAHEIVLEKPSPRAPRG